MMRGIRSARHRGASAPDELWFVHGLEMMVTLDGHDRQAERRRSPAWLDHDQGHAGEVG
jgi:hypothetical protein